MVQPTCCLAWCRVTPSAQQCLAFKGVTSNECLAFSNSGVACSGWSDQTHWFLWQPSHVSGVVWLWLNYEAFHTLNQCYDVERPVCQWLSETPVHEQNQLAYSLSLYRGQSQVDIFKRPQHTLTHYPVTFTAPEQDVLLLYLLYLCEYWVWPLIWVTAHKLSWGSSTNKQKHSFLFLHKSNY